MEKQYLAVELNHKIKDLEQQNFKLVTMIKEQSDRSEIKTSNDGNTEADKNEDEFNLEE